MVAASCVLFHGILAVLRQRSLADDNTSTPFIVRRFRAVKKFLRQSEATVVA